MIIRISPKVIMTLYFLSIAVNVIGQGKSNIDASVKLNFSSDSNGCGVISWIKDDGANGYQVYRKQRTDISWGSIIADYPADSLRYTDCDMEDQAIYEYKIEKKLDASSGFGYITSGRLIPPTHFKGRCLVVIDKISYDLIRDDIDRYQRVIRSEGWKVINIIIERDSSAQFVKSEIYSTIEKYGEIDRILILGHVAVPYSGNINPDGHNNHRGAWSADLYYGELDGAWTDESIDNVTSSNASNHNIPGDGKYDQSRIPSDIDIAIGRVDFHDLPAFDDDEYILLKKYIDKSIAYRTKKIQPLRRAILQDNFNFPEGFAQSGIRSFSTMVGQDSIHYGTISRVFDQSYLWMYGAGGGSYTSASGILNTTNLAQDSIQAVFTMMFGSYFGDYDSKNNLMRSMLASGTALSCAWSGRPHWVFHPMGLGADLGSCTLLSQNNNGLYPNGFGVRSVHVNLIGDPTLTSYVVAPPSNLIATENSDGHVLVEWTSSPQIIDGYYLYRRGVDEIDFELINTGGVERFYIDSCLVANETVEYLVRAYMLEQTPSGSFYNLSGGPTYQITPLTNIGIEANFTYTIDYPFLITLNESMNANQYQWIVDGILLSDSTDIQLDLSLSIPTQVMLVASNDCAIDTIIVDIMPVGVDHVGHDPFIVSPNPASDYISLIGNDLIRGVDVWTLNGVLLIRRYDQRSIDIQSIPPGVYIVKIHTESTSEIQRLIVER